MEKSEKADENLFDDREIDDLGQRAEEKRDVFESIRQGCLVRSIILQEMAIKVKDGRVVESREMLHCDVV